MSLGRKVGSKILQTWHSTACWIDLQVVPRTDREVIARIRNCILALANCKMMLYDTSIFYAFEESQKYEVSYALDYLKNDH
jgi:hypothetical protein